ncbi:hypothetical protein PLICRDRAFT_36100 [Plicaturopsis crispa FD-325 SS-3]|nr:hypothetical protein PLICRDRAFT_36100 [Plicaturopsis crispa FD-325 SS-3]
MPAMTEEPKPTPRPRRRLFVSNPDSDADDDEKQSGELHRPYCPPPLPSPSTRSQYAQRPMPPHYAPPPLTTNLPPDTQHHSSSSRSNPTLSSPSTTDSPIIDIDSTPPPSTPGVSAPPVDLSGGDGPSRNEKPPAQPFNEPCTPSRAMNILDKVKSHLPRSHYSKSHSRPHTSPTVSATESNSWISTPSQTSASSKSTLSQPLLIIVTTDSEQYQKLDIKGASDAAYIRERIFTRLRVSDEDQANFSIYRTEIGAYAQGEALSDEELFKICREEGDDKGTLKFFVSHSSATVHDLSQSQCTSASSTNSPTVHTIPPPVLPHVGGGFTPLKPHPRPSSRHGSNSSASERLHEPSGGYDASVSDDENGDRDTHRSTLRPPAHQSALLSGSVQIPPSPSGSGARRPYGPVPRPHSPVLTHVARPASPVDRARAAYRADKHNGNSSMHQQSVSPIHSTFNHRDDNTLTAPTKSHVRSGSDTAAEREQALLASENMVEQAGRQWSHLQQREERGKQERSGGPPMTRVRKDQKQDRSQTGGNDDSSRDWVLVNHNGVNGTNRERPTTPQEGPRSSPIPPRGLHRSKESTYSPSRYHSPSGGYTGKRLPIPNEPRNPPPAPPNTRPGQVVPAAWANTSKPPDKNDTRPPPSGVSRVIAKSMDNLRNAYQYPTHPPTLQPGSKPPRRLPVTTPSTSNLREAAAMSPGKRDPNVRGLPRSREVQRGSHSPHPLPRPPPGSAQGMSSNEQNQSQYSGRGPVYSPGSSRSSVYPPLMSPTLEPFPRPQSAFGDGLSSPTAFQSRQGSVPMSRHGSEESDDVRSPRALSPTQPTYTSTGRSMPDSYHNGRIGGAHALKINPNGVGSFSDRPSDSHHLGGPRTPPPRSPASPRNSGLGEKPSGLLSYESTLTPSMWSYNSSRQSQDDTPATESTLKPDDHEWIARMIDGEASDFATAPRLPDPVQSPTYDDDDSSSDENGTLWSTPMAEKVLSPRPKSILRGPHLTVQTEGSRHSRNVQYSTQPPKNFPPPPSMPPPTPGRHLSTKSSHSKPDNRGSKFEMHPYTWAPRPPPEEMYDRLEEYFPEHDLDKPVIEASSGQTSPTAAEHPAVPPPVNVDKSRVRAKKSIRIVAEEHKKKIDRTSRSDSSTITSVLRKRSTKLWGSKLEEVTTGQAKSIVPTTLPDSPSGGPKPIFKWVRGELIGRGTYGRVYLALNATTGEMIAVKQVEMPRTTSDKNHPRQVNVVEALKLESETLKDLDHPNIVQYLGFEETPKFLSIFLEYVPGGSVGSCLRKYGKFDEDVTKSFTSQILAGLEYLHSKGILHRDLKADNILVETSGVCKISDFGISKRTDDIDRNGHTAMQGSVFWMAPEVISPQKKGYNAKVDIWSVGCVILEMWAGERPWSEEEAVAVMLKLYSDKLPPPVPNDVVLSPAALDFRNKCFATNPEDRPSAAELRKHPYLILPPGWTFNSFK